MGKRLVQPDGIKIVATEETIASCTVCGQQNYEMVPQGKGTTVAPNGVPLFNLRISPNDFQTYVTTLCVPCMSTLHTVLGVALAAQTKEA